ncbi:MAG: hypothetical protein QXO76_01250 [Thermoproteota archaeon]
MVLEDRIKNIIEVTIVNTRRVYLHALKERSEETPNFETPVYGILFPPYVDCRAVMEQALQSVVRRLPDVFQRDPTSMPTPSVNITFVRPNEIEVEFSDNSGLPVTTVMFPYDEFMTPSDLYDMSIVVFDGILNLSSNIQDACISFISNYIDPVGKNFLIYFTGNAFKIPEGLGKGPIMVSGVSRRICTKIGIFDCSNIELKRRNSYVVF